MKIGPYTLYVLAYDSNIESIVQLHLTPYHSSTGSTGAATILLEKDDQSAVLLLTSGHALYRDGSSDPRVIVQPYASSLRVEGSIYHIWRLADTAVDLGLVRLPCSLRYLESHFGAKRKEITELAAARDTKDEPVREELFHQQKQLIREAKNISAVFSSEPRLRNTGDSGMAQIEWSGDKLKFSGLHVMSNDLKDWYQSAETHNTYLSEVLTGSVKPNYGRL